MSTLIPTSEVNESGKAKRSGVERLRVAAAEASQVRALSTHPDVVALRVEAIRTQVDRCMWLGIVLGLAFTMVNVQDFAARGAAVFSLAWFAAWLLDPMVSLVLIAVLRAEQITARYQVSDVGPWIGRTKRFAFAATYAMNTWSSFLTLDVAGIVLHSVPPLLVFCAAETAPVLRDRLTEAVLRAEQAAALADPVKAAEPLEMSRPAVQIPDAPAALESASAALADTASSHVARKPPKPRKKAAAKHGRKLLADYVADALAGVEPGVEITPAWARRVSGCSAGLSVKVAAAVRDELSKTTKTTTAAPVAVETTTDDAAATGDDFARAAA
ncbi:hypothetical protein GCM10009789_19420 [Kribbella sancticallisti]|uniref:DUF2637 domain-containing protein n=1 Tax=Kribbella sancticallisti TaxID=460087 RepID=A0ABP4NS31_9ACTN